MVFYCIEISRYIILRNLYMGEKEGNRFLVRNVHAW